MVNSVPRPGELKILVTGPVGAGKTTAIRCIGEGATVSTDVPVSGGAIGDKSTTTVGLDYSVCELPDGTVLKLFGTPGQDRFAFMWDTLAAGAFGLIVLADNSQPDAIAQVETYLRALAGPIGPQRTVVGVGRLDAHPSPGIDAYCAHLEAAGWQVPVIDVDVRRETDVRLLLSVVVSLAEADACAAPAGGHQ